ncbi:hypothetical protein [Anaerosacchariphilus polymeriproducens]|uniref:Uncharacterized protein n=1 Tax=Anaerosacchariphilus polymeriproducens TaxID=1812858 RepID=A0A371ATJ1_9FIRM|nr:hypothetical protein [Anaerosacchariphilus polymeriproducens]RDU22871.1 hypothetical protein DWV06_12425 [Anaerosacchariphilus polymeriproducens]
MKRTNEILKKIEKEIFQTARTVSVNGSTYVSFNDIRVIMNIYATNKDVGIKTRGDVIRKSNENLAEFVGYTVNYPYAHCTSMPESVDDYIFDILAYLNQPVEEE